MSGQVETAGDIIHTVLAVIATSAVLFALIVFALTAGGLGNCLRRNFSVVK